MKTNNIKYLKNILLTIVYLSNFYNCSAAVSGRTIDALKQFINTNNAYELGLLLDKYPEAANAEILFSSPLNEAIQKSSNLVEILLKKHANIYNYHFDLLLKALKELGQNYHCDLESKTFILGRDVNKEKLDDLIRTIKLLFFYGVSVSEETKKYIKDKPDLNKIVQEGIAGQELQKQTIDSGPFPDSYQKIEDNIFDAIKNYNLPKLRLWISRYPNFIKDLARRHQRITFLNDAVESRNPEIVKFLLESGADPNQIGELSQSLPLESAIYDLDNYINHEQNIKKLNDVKEIIKLLIDYGTDLSSKEGKKAIESSKKFGLYTELEKLINEVYQLRHARTQSVLQESNLPPELIGIISSYGTSIEPSKVAKKEIKLPEEPKLPKKAASGPASIINIWKSLWQKK